MATLALVLWIPVTLVLFARRRGKASPASTVAWSLLVGLMVLPSKWTISMPLVAMNKLRIMYLAVLLALLIFHGGFWRARKQGKRTIEWVFVWWAVATCLQVWTNTDTLHFIGEQIRGHRPTEIISCLAVEALDWYLPFIIGYRVFRTPKDLRHLLTAVATGVLIYSLPVLFEVRMSPQLHLWIYGYRTQSWLQVIRDGGFRPSVMMSHGLGLAMFLFSGVVACAGLAKSRRKIGRFKAWHAMLFIFVTLVLCKSKGALVFAAAGAPLVLYGSRTFQRTVCIIAVSVLVTYPALRTYDIFPADDIIEYLEGINPKRAESLAFRFTHEAELLEHALERPWFGWGGYGRWRVRDAEGRDISVTDGLWAILFGRGGWAYYLAACSLFFVPVWRARKRLKTLRTRDSHMLAALMVIVALYGADQLPNSMFDSLPLVYGGALLSIATHWKVTTRRKGRGKTASTDAPPATAAQPATA